MLSHVDIKEIPILSVFVLQLIPMQEELDEVTGPNVQKVNNGIITMAGNIVMTFQAFLKPLTDFFATFLKLQATLS